jgi:hypothetical protein
LIVRLDRRAGSLALAALIGASCSAGCGSGSDSPARPVEAAKCVPRTAEATPPPRDPPVPTTPDRERAKGESVNRVRPCPPGQVPSSTPARPTVGKGNPLIGSVPGSAREFFRTPREAGSRIRKRLRRFRDVYPKGGGKPPPDPPGCNGVVTSGSCFYYGSAAYGRDADGGGTTMAVASPAYDGSGGAGHSLDEISVQGGADSGDIIELGWNVSTAQYTDSNPHLFVFHWKGWTPTCYDTCGWNQYSGGYSPGADLSALAGREVYVGWVHYRGNWWAWFDNQWLGYFQDSEWDGGYTRNSLIQWFGEVATANGIPPHTDMGNGTAPSDERAARNATLCDVDVGAWVCWYRDKQATGETFPSYYGSARSGFGEVRYGGPGE